jgi:hypothetical protein
MAKRPSELRSEWEALKQESVAQAAEAKALRGLPSTDPKVMAEEAAAAMLGVKKELLATAAWVADARDLADVLLLAEIAWSLNGGVGTFPQLPADIDDCGPDELSIAYLLKGIFDASQAQGISEGEHS